MRGKITEAEFELLVDLALLRRLRTDSEYNNAENADHQDHRETVLALAVIAELEEKYEVSG